MRHIHLPLVSGLLLAGCAGAGPEPQSRPPVTEMGEPSKDVDPEEIGTVVRANPSRFQRCYEDARARNPSLSGLIEVRLLINSDGSVGQAMAAETDLPAAVANCVVDAFYDLRLPERDSAVIAQYPMYFQPG